MLISRESPVNTRKSLETANTYARAGIAFVAVPVFTEDQRAAAIKEADERLTKMIDEIEGQ